MNKTLLYIFTLLPILAACSSKAGSEEFDGQIIRLSAVVGAETKAVSDPAVYMETTPSADSPLKAEIWFSTTSGEYPGTADGNGVSQDGTTVDTHRTITYTSGNPTTPSGINDTYLRYPSGNGKIYCVGLYPCNTPSRWTVAENGAKAQALINGSDDLMFAKQLSGNSDDKLTYKRQDFKHLLTLIKVRVRTASVEAADTWGHLKTISINSKDLVTVDLSATDLNADGAVVFSNSGAQDAKFFTFDGDEELTTVSKARGMTFVSPVTANGDSGAEYTIHIVCDNYSKDVPVNLVNEDGTSFSGNTAGYVFVVTLFFKTLTYIEGSVTLEKWTEEYTDLTLQ